MKKYSANEIRNLWLDFWKSKGHKVLPSASLIPKNDPSLLWINSGVATLKDYFSGLKIPANRRIVNSQKSVRTNDIENVGSNSRHHTLFEMLGNFSIGDYFKDRALVWAFEFLFDVLQFDQNNIYITYYEKDQYTYQKWKELGIKDDHLIKGNKITNFWDLGSGPCGPDTEIFYDRGIKYDPQKIGIRALIDDLENDRYIEIWNIVFSEFNNDGNGNYIELKQKNIDTGAGLERITSIFQDAPTNFDTDLFLPIIKKIATMTDKQYVINNYFIKDQKQTKINKFFRIIADHIRTICQMINDGALPSNIKRGYVIRRLIRRAYYAGIQLSIKKETFLYDLVQVVNNTLPVYPLMIDYVKKIIKNEEITFSKTIKNGKKILSKFLSKKNNFNSKIIFKLFETYGFPIELSAELLQQKGVKFDLNELKKLKQKHIEVSQNKNFFRKNFQTEIVKNVYKKISQFIGYDYLQSNSKILSQEENNGKYYLLLDKTPFYATKGGQIHDLGLINNLPVLDVFRDKYDNNWHIVGSKINSKNVVAKVDAKVRAAKARNHSATHILGHALRNVVSQDITQLGSENNELKLRFDFPLHYKLTKKQILKVEKVANDLVLAAIPREYIIDTFANGFKMGALAIESEINSDPEKLSRIVKFNGSIEFCGGTHVKNTRDIEIIKIVKVESKGSGTYRIEAITSEEKVKNFKFKKQQELIKILKNLDKKIKKINSSYQIIYNNKNIEELKKIIEDTKKTIKLLNKKNHNLKINFKVSFIKYKGMNTFIKLDLDSKKDIKSIAVHLRRLYPDKLLIIGAIQKDHFLVAVASKHYDCEKVFAELVKKNGGNGGGNKNFAMGKINNFKN